MNTAQKLAEKVRALIGAGSRFNALLDQENQIFLDKVSEAAFQLTTELEIFRNRFEAVFSPTSVEVNLPNDCFLVQQVIVTEIDGVLTTPRELNPTSLDAVMRGDNLGFNRGVKQFGQTLSPEPSDVKWAREFSYYVNRSTTGSKIGINPFMTCKATVLYHQFLPREHLANNAFAPLTFSEFFKSAIIYRAARLSAYALADLLVEESLEKRNTFNVKVAHYQSEETYYIEQCVRPPIRQQTQKMNFKPDYFYDER